MANTRGGPIVIGVEEDDGRAGKPTPFAVTDEALVKMKRRVTEFVMPFVQTEITRVDEDAGNGTGYFVVAVPKSANAPHAVRKKGALRYSRRD